ncbi:hypothetical protein GCM10022236_22210 [Microlunatus ginsengisoli]|uniref:Lipoprotein n=2 Tax=Microlunatus ginsengisoli TaxID=363863 RepID=A0ABP6ZTZ5_9ACTN
MRVRLGAAVAAACLLGLVGCDSGGGPSPSPTPTVQPSPPETSLERQQREDFEAAEKAYRTFIADTNRVAATGGSLEPTAVMKATAAGPYLDFQSQLLRAQKKAGDTHTSGVEIGYIRTGGYSPSQLTLEVCEDASKNRVLDRNGNQVSTGQILLRSLYVRRIDGRWKVWDGDEKGTASSCE